MLRISVGFGVVGHPLADLPLEETHFAAAFLEVLAEGLGFFGIILWFQGINDQRHA
ncbi:hypothetical protein [Reyranella soli]|uniref:hypothetical protein n=1 Tax=Reyranella soli TaxID=1230389 RepID=UPI00147969DC|nr:hypothetical protein [Reyranella soli]